MFSDNLIMLRFGETKIAKGNVYPAKKSINFWDVNIDNTITSKLIEKTNSKCLIGYLGKVITPLVLILPKMSRYMKTLKVKGGDKD